VPAIARGVPSGERPGDQLALRDVQMDPSLCGGHRVCSQGGTGNGHHLIRVVHVTPDQIGCPPG
jgi:hypothetical protein